MRAHHVHLHPAVFVTPAQLHLALNLLSKKGEQRCHGWGHLHADAEVLMNAHKRWGTLRLSHFQLPFEEVEVIPKFQEYPCPWAAEYLLWPK